MHVTQTSDLPPEHQVMLNIKIKKLSFKYKITNFNLLQCVLPASNHLTQPDEPPDSQPDESAKFIEK